MICNWCNREIPENSNNCPYCGTVLNSTNNNSYVNIPESKEEKANIGLAILSWFIPLAGLIIYLVKKDKEPKTAKVSGICALISFIINLIVVIAIMLMFAGLALNLENYISDTFEDAQENQIIDNETDDKNNDSNQPVIGNTSTDWKKYEIELNGQKLALPTTYNAINQATGFTYKSASLKSYLQAGYYTLLNMYKNDKLALYVEILNDTNNDMLYTDCKITRVSQTKYQVSQGADIITFPGGLKVGIPITETEILQLFGTPDDTHEYSSEGYETKTYSYFENSNFTTTNNFEITVVNGVIDELELDKRN